MLCLLVGSSVRECALGKNSLMKESDRKFPITGERELPVLSVQ